MKRIVVWLSCVVMFVSACTSASRPTEIKVTAPASKSTVKVGQSVAIQGIVMGDAISRVDVLVNNELYASLTAPDKTKGVSTFPFTVPWTPKQVGTHGVQLKVFSPDDKILQQSEIIILTADPATAAPIVPTSALVTATSAAAGGSSAAAPIAATTTAPAVVQNTPVAAEAAAEAPSITVTNEFVNVRKGPGINYDAVGKLNEGEKATARGKSADGKWWQISFGNGVGWVLGEYVKANAAAEKLQLAAAPPPPTAVPAPPPTQAPAKSQQPSGGDLKALPTAPKP